MMRSPMLRGARVPGAAILAALAVPALLAGGCLSHERPDAGKPPEGPTRVLEPAEAKARREAAAREGGAGSGALASRGVVAVRASRIYHREGCTVLEEAMAAAGTDADPEAAVVRFADAWIALDSDQTPCSHCRPGP